ncbi:hypothetical protein [Caldisalinibacter kiritimatiensis]|uniref:hypothetical protein n=1 Tax=Caldisalinibacter kiritimatiensis TaxID=1304284 RepID=UPI000556903A|nr:hypothetical protein [Caldisalinibacter kiritimatiensis]
MGIRYRNTETKRLNRGYQHLHFSNIHLFKDVYTGQEYSEPSLIMKMAKTKYFAHLHNSFPANH